MYVLADHTIADPPAFWADVAYLLSSPPRHLTLHHCLPTPDGTHAVFLWEAERIADVRGYLESVLGHLSRTAYYPVENLGGVALPSGVRLPALPGLPAPGGT